MQIQRDPDNGDVTTTTLGEITTVEQTDGHGQLASAYAAYSSTPLYAEEILERDALGRIVLRRETVQGTATEYGYAYDNADRLWQVSIGGAIEREYGYDANGNRTALVMSSGTETCSYDAQDRIASCDDTLYEHNLVGQRTRKTVQNTVTRYDYDVLGNLRQVELPDGRVVEYEIDGQNRRIGKKVNGVRQWGLLYQTELAPIAQVDASNRAVSVFIYATWKHVPDYMIKDGRTYRFVLDHLGSVRLVVDAEIGTVEHRLDYDEFGNVLNDTNPEFQPFGFAGGLHDSDTGLVRFGVRDYDPEVGRWTAKDPGLFIDGTNLYAYVNNDSINRTDPSGLYGTNDCSYYQQRCAESGGWYYCTLAQKACDWFWNSEDPDPDSDDDFEGWARCTRQCLQDCDRVQDDGRHPWSGGQTVCPAKPDPATDEFWDRGSFECHAACYVGCAAWGIGIGGP